MREPILESFLHLTSCKNFSMAYWQHTHRSLMKNLLSIS